MATFCCMPRLICSTGRSIRFSEMPSRARIAIASRLAVLPSRPYSRAAKRRFSIGLSFLKKAASTLTRLIRRLTAISSRTMSWPKTSTRPSSRVSSPQMSRMSVDLPEPLAPRIPWMSPRSRRSDTCEIAVTGFFFRPTTNRLLTSSMRRAGTAVVAGRPQLGPIGSDRLADRSVLQFVGQEWRSRWAPGSGAGWRVPEMDESRGSVIRRCRRWASRLVVLRVCRWAGEGIKKAGGPIWPTALVRPEGGPAACGLARDGHRSPDCGTPLGATHRWRSDRRRHHSSRLLVGEICARDMRAGRQSTRRAKRVSTRSDDDVRDRDR